MNIPIRISKWVDSWVARSGFSEKPVIVGLAGDGSQRKFFRVSLGAQSFVVLDDDTWISSKDYAPHQQYLQKRGLPVPAFVEIDEAQGVGVLEDLGDELLQFTVRRLITDRSLFLAWMRRAVTLLADLHGKTFPVPKELPVASRFFDEEKYFQEMSFTWEHLVKGFLKLDTPLPEQKMRQFCRTIGSLKPEVFCHRDYHTRNILVFKDDLFLIDFQDARLGSPVYDLASLIFDAYVHLTPQEKTELAYHYRTSVGKYEPLAKAISWDHFDRDLAWVGLQRIVKAAGSFASFYTRFQKGTHLPYLLPALDTAKILLKEVEQTLPATQGLFPVDEWIASAKIQLAKVQP